MLSRHTMFAQKAFVLANIIFQGDKMQLKPCRFAYILSLCTQEWKKSFIPLFYDVCEGLQIVDSTLDVTSISYDCKHYLSVLTKENKLKMDKIRRREI